MSSKRMVRCSVGEQTYCIDSDWLDSIQVIENLYPSRSAGGSIGWIRRFDEKVPVYRLADQIEGTSRGPSRQGVIMVMRREEKLWGLLVDKVAAASEVTDDHVFPLPAVVGDPVNGKFPSVIVEEDGLTLYLSPDRVVPTEVGAAQTRPAATRTTPASRVRRNIERAVPDITPDRKTGRQIITFAIEGVEKARFAVSAGQAMEILSDPKMIAVPQAPSFALGLIAWRALPVPVIDLPRWLGMDSPPEVQPGGRLLIVRGTVGSSRRDPGLLAIPGVDDIRKVDLPMAYRPWTEAVRWNASLALGVYQAERTMLVVPDLDAILCFEAAVPAYRM